MCGSCGANTRHDADHRMDRGTFLKLGGGGLAGAFAGAALLGTGGGAALARPGRSLGAEFGRAAGEHGVPKDLLLAMGYVNTLWEMPPPDATPYDRGNPHGRGAYGTMQLVQNPSRDTLGKASRLTGIPEGKLKSDRAANVEGGAALLAEMSGRDKPKDLNGWREVVAEYGDSDYYAQEVYEALRDGAELTVSSGERLSLGGRAVAVPRVLAGRTSGEYVGSFFSPAYSGNYRASSREGSYNIYRIIVHVVEGSAPAAVNWFQDPAAGVSAHYVVGRKGTIVQCVRNKDIGYHAGNWDYNTNAIGIEHAGYGANPRTWTKRMYLGSARLAAWLCKRHYIPIQAGFIRMHRRVPGSSTACPGPHFSMERYLRLVRYFRRRIS